MDVIPRFIPTGVGNTRAADGHGRRSSVHPHGRGEHCPALMIAVYPFGSSPRAWGTPQPLPSRSRFERFIPTGVGNTPSQPGLQARAPVHPHGRGEHVAFRPEQVKSAGSSPRAWGTR